MATPAHPNHLGVRRFARIRRGERLVARALFCFLAAVYVLVATGLPDHNDSETEYQTTSALGRGQGFALGGTPESDALVEYRFAQPDSPLIPAKVGRDGTSVYSWFGTGQALSAVPLYWVGKGLGAVFPGVEERFAERTTMGIHRSEYYAHLLVGMRNPLLGAVTAWLVVLCALRLGLTRRFAFLAGLTYGLCTFALPQARSTLSDVQATACLFGAFYLILTAREFLERARRPARKHLIAAGTLLAMAFLTRVVTAPAIAVLAIAMIGVLLRGHLLSPVQGESPPRKVLLRDLADFCLPALAGVVLFLGFNYLRFGGALETGYGDVVSADSFFAFSPWVGLLLLCFAPGKGLVFLAPGLVIAPLGWPWAEGGAGRFFCWTTLGVSLAVFAPIVPTETWHGAWTFGPRYVLPALPFLWLGVAVAFERLQGRARLGAAGLMLVGAVVALGGTLTDHMTHQDLAVQAARLDWPDQPGGDDARFQSIQTDLRYAAPWAHWRILRHRVAGLGEDFSSAEIFYTEVDGVLTPGPDQRRGFTHLAWVDHAGLGGSTWPILFLVGGLLVLGMRLLASARIH